MCVYFFFSNTIQNSTPMPLVWTVKGYLFRIFTMHNRMRVLLKSIALIFFVCCYQQHHHHVAQTKEVWQMNAHLNESTGNSNELLSNWCHLIQWHILRFSNGQIMSKLLRCKSVRQCSAYFKTLIWSIGMMERACSRFFSHALYMYYTDESTYSYISHTLIQYFPDACIFSVCFWNGFCGKKEKKSAFWLATLFLLYSFNVAFDNWMRLIVCQYWLNSTINQIYLI